MKKSTFEKYRLVNIVVKLNQVTIREANLPLSADKFSEKFADYAIFSCMDFFSCYDQVELDNESRNRTVFITSLGLMLMTTLLQDITNSIAPFVRIVFKILAQHLRD